MFNLKKKKMTLPEESAEAPASGVAGPTDPADVVEAAVEPEDPDAPEEEIPEEEKVTEEPEEKEEKGLGELFGEWLDANVPDGERRSSALEGIGVLGDCIESGEWSEELFDLIARGADYARAVAEAESRGEVRGRNANIEELMELEYATDGVPHPGSGTNIGRSPSIFDVARDARL